MHLDLLPIDLLGVGGQVRLQLVRVDAELLLQVGDRRAAEVDLRLVGRGEVRPVALRRLGVGDRVAVLGLVLAVEDERNLVQQRHFRRQRFLAEDERLERVEQVLDREPGEEPVDAAVRRAQEVVESGVDPRLEVLPAPLGVDVRRPRHRERMHAVLVLQHVRGVEAVLAARAGDEAVVGPVLAAEAVAEVLQPALALAPVDHPLLLLGHPAGVADAVGVEVDRLLLAVPGVLVLDRRVRPLVGDDAAAAERDLQRQPVACGVGLVLAELREIDLAMAGVLRHAKSR
jgi:hypothetical protein